MLINICHVTQYLVNYQYILCQAMRVLDQCQIVHKYAFYIYVYIVNTVYSLPGVAVDLYC